MIVESDDEINLAKARIIFIHYKSTLTEQHIQRLIILGSII